MAVIVAIITTAVAALASPPPAVSVTPEAVTSHHYEEGAPPPVQGSTSLRALPGAAGLASWYGRRPSACWDARGRHSLPAGLIAFTAHPTLPCGAMVAVSGPAGTITVPVEDHGPESWTGRALDLNPAAFLAVAGNLWTGVVPVTWRTAA